MPQVEQPAPIGSLLLGRLEGRMDALEVRMTRAEDASAARVVVIETKLDSLSTTLAQGLGGMRVAHWIGGAMLALVGFLLRQFWVQH